ncbi:unnamed protein product [Rotaria sp. Silwood2]|nr:unnamed protein product [Rotaria sp. Silwood2]CAF4590169.1 unnamed protein product [Rotaria sp. Silwood2]
MKQSNVCKWNIILIEDLVRINDQEIKEETFEEKIGGTELRHLTWNNFLTVARALLMIEPSKTIMSEAFMLLIGDRNKSKLKISILIQCLILLRPDIEQRSASEEKKEEEEDENSEKTKDQRSLRQDEFRRLIHDYTFRAIIGAQKSSLDILYNNLQQFQTDYDDCSIQ